MKTRTTDILYENMLRTTPVNVATTALKAVNAIQTDKTENQLLGLAAVLVVMLKQYDLTATEVLGIADNYVYSGYNNNPKPEFKALKQFMRDEWAI